MPALRQASVVGGNYFVHFMVDTTIHDKLLRLGYSQLWLDNGMLTVENLDNQIKELDLGEDDNTEHYRYRTFTNYFNLQTSFDNSILKQILQLLQSDRDKTMAGSATVALLRKSCLTDEQFDIVVEFLQTFGDWTTKQIDKARQQRMKF
jgi:hypothetical protein